MSDDVEKMAGQFEERRQIIEWLRSGEGIGGDDAVARTIADAILHSEHVLWAHARDLKARRG